jgi:hypothetical protein
VKTIPKWFVTFGGAFSDYSITNPNNEWIDVTEEKIYIEQRSSLNYSKGVDYEMVSR